MTTPMLGKFLGIVGQDPSDSKSNRLWSKTTLNYCTMVERYPSLKEGVGGANIGCEVSCLLDIKLARWSTVACALTSTHRPSVSKKRKKSNRLHIRHLPVMLFIHLRYIPQIPLKRSVKFMKSPTSTGSSATHRRVFRKPIKPT